MGFAFPRIIVELCFQRLLAQLFYLLYLSKGIELIFRN